MEKKITIEGMSCNHCKIHVEKALSNIEGVEAVQVELVSKTAIVKTNRDIESKTFIDVIDDAGYEVISVE